MTKKLLPLLLFLITIANYTHAQEKRIYGSLYKSLFGNFHQYQYPSFQKINKFKVYLLVEQSRNSKSLFKCKSKNSHFDFSITKQEDSIYKYLEFHAIDYYKESRNEYSTIVKIDTLKNDSLTLFLDRVVDSNEIIIVGKPAIYLYPLHKNKIEIVNNFKGTILNTYPEYHNKWSIIAEPNGILTNCTDNKKYSYLFWDGSYSFPKEHYNFTSGFYIKRENTINFLQEHLKSIGLNNTEINDFIIYWLPLLNKNECNFIHFRINDDIDHSSHLVITPKPKTEIVIFMEFEKYDETENVPKLPTQHLYNHKREGFTMIEWGGAEINSNRIE